MSVENIELIKNGSFSSVSIDSSYGWHVPTNWQVVWNNKKLDGTLTLSSVGAVYCASNALIFDYTPDPDFYDTVYNRIFPPGIYQEIKLEGKDLTDVDYYTFSLNVRLDTITYEDLKESEFDVFLYEGYYNSAFDTYEIHYDATFEDYILNETFTVSSEEWTTITFELDARFLSNKVYMIGITPHVHISGVKNDNEVYPVHIVIDDASFMMTTKKDEGEDVEDTGIIVNGSFTDWKDGLPSGWFTVKPEDYYGPFKLSQSNDYGRNSSLVMEFNKEGYHATFNKSEIAPGVYQLIDLSGYDKALVSLKLSFDFAVRLDNINHTFSQYQSYNANFFVYKVDENGSPIGGLTSYKYRKELNFSGLKPSEWIKYYCNVELAPGYYCVGFAPSIEFEVPAAQPLFMVVDDFVGTLDQVNNIVVYEELVAGGALETSTDMTHWIYDDSKLNASLRTELREDYLRPVLGVQCCNIYYNNDVFIDDIEPLYYGFKQSVISRAESKALFSFWYSTYSKDPIKFKVCVYEEEYNAHSGSYEVTKTIFEKTVTTSSVGWNNYTSILYLDYGVHYTIAFYPYDDINRSLSGILLDKVSLTTYQERELTHSGTYKDPFTDEDVLLLYNLDVNSGEGTPVFFSYHPDLPQKEYFIRYNGYYYCTSGATDNLGRFIAYSNVMVQSPCGIEGSRFFFQDGKMARNQIFEYNGAYYQASSDGSLTQSYPDILNIWTDPVDIETITVDVGRYQTIKVYFEEQEYDIILNAEIQNTSIAAVTQISGGIYSNTIEVYGKSRGETNLRIYYRNVTGYIAEKVIKIKVINQAESIEGNVYIAYRSNAINSGGSLAIDYFILPEYVTSLPLEWSSSDESIATVDMYGNVYGHDYDRSCTITVTNPYTQQSDSCIIYVGNIYDAQEIKTSEDTLSLSLGETKRVTAEVLGESLDTLGVVQDVKWASSNTKIATVNKYGFITGVARGTIDITCTSVHNPSVSKTVSVHVVGTPVDVQGIELDCEYYSTDMRYIAFNTSWDNNYIIVKHRFIPSNANTTSVIWESNYEDMVKVTPSGKVYLNPTYNGEGGSATITCRCSKAPTIYKQFKVYVDIGAQYQAVITAFDTEFNTYVGQTLRINYGVFFLRNAMNDGVIGNVSITTETTNTVINNEDDNGPYINFTANEAGTFTVRVTAANTYRDFTINVFEQNIAPQIADDLKIMHALQNGTCVLRCQIKDDLDKLDNLKYYIDFGDGNGYEMIYTYTNLMDTNPEQYFFIADYYGLAPDIVYRTKIKAIDPYGLETETNAVDLVIPKSEANKASLAAAKADYDYAMELLLNILDWIIAPTEMAIPDRFKPTFFIQYQTYCYVYENLRDMLDKCIEHINNKIKAEQSEVATLAAGLASDGTSVATYSEGDYTNSNYQNVSDMDYYQNICIKELTNRVLQLEALIQQLINNNN